MPNRVAELNGIANQLRIHSIRSTTEAGSGHPTSCASAADLVAALFFHKMRYFPNEPQYVNNDRFVLSKGHAAPLLYAAWAEAGHIDPSSLTDLRKFDSPLEGHPTPRLDFVDVATGSLGQGLSVGAGMAIHARMEKLDHLTYVLLGDGELSEGSVWEAANFAGIRKLSNLVAIVDVNRLGQTGPTAFGWNVEVYRQRFEAFDWNTTVVDGHDMRQILDALEEAGRTSYPLAIIAKTVKGHRIQTTPPIENELEWHGKALSKDQARQAIEMLKPISRSAKGYKIPEPKRVKPASVSVPAAFPPPRYDRDEPVATRAAFGNALLRVGSLDRRIVALDGDVENSTCSEMFAERFPERFLECYIAEQNMVGCASGLAATGKIPVVATFGAFLTRAMDQIRMAGVSQIDLKLVGTHSGVSIGEDGPSQMALEDIACLRAIPGSAVLCPADAVAAERLFEKMIEHPGVAYLRAARMETPILYTNEEHFAVGGARVLRQSDPKDLDQVTIVAAGVPVFEALKAYELLKKRGIHAAVIDAYSIKPLARHTILAVARRTHNQLISVEDHYWEGGLGDALASELSPFGIRVHKLAVAKLPRSGTKEELYSYCRIDAQAIVEKALELTGGARIHAA